MRTANLNKKTNSLAFRNEGLKVFFTVKKSQVNYLYFLLRKGMALNGKQVNPFKPRLGKSRGLYLD